MGVVAKIYSVARRELRCVVRDRLYLSTMFVLPLLMVLFFTLVFHRGSIEELPVAVVDNDHTSLSRRLRNMISATQGINVAYMPDNMAVAEWLMLSGKVDGVILIEEGFESGIMGGRTMQMECYLPGTNMAASGVVERDLESCVQTFAAGITIGKLQAKGLSRDQALVDIMPINFHTHIISNPYFNYGYYLAPIFMFMGVVIFTVVLTVYAVGRELRYSTAGEWMDRAGGSLFVATLGKMLPITIAMALVMQLIFMTLFVVMGMECRGSYLLLTICSVLFIAAYQSVAVLIVALTANMRLALSLGGGYAVMAFTFSGITFPLSAMFDVARWVSNIFPMTWFSNIFVDDAMRGVPFSYSWVNVVVLTLFLVLFVVAMPRLRRVATNDNYWGRD